MRFTRLSDTAAHEADPAHFTLPAGRHDLIAVDDPPSSALLVKFGPGGRTHWHRHPNGQYLHVVEGKGRVQSRGGEVVHLLPGDTVYAEPGEEHWHGAAEDHEVAHLAFSFGRTEWAGPVDAEPK
jgi:quercetin dioxygenase-like cupin family protein